MACSVTRSPNLPVWVSFSVTTRLVQNNCSHVRFSVKITCDPVSHHTPAAVADFVSVCPAHRHAELTPLPLSAHRVAFPAVAFLAVAFPAFPAPGRKTNQPFSDLASSTVLRLHVPAGSRSIASHPPSPCPQHCLFQECPAFSISLPLEATHILRGFFILTLRVP